MTRDDLHMDDDFNKDTVSRFDKNTYDLGNVYLNINAKGYMNMNAGDTYELDVFRNWQAIEGFMNAKIALPDAHYEVVDFDGKPSDVVSIAPNADNSCLAYMTANHQGTALVKVTYDAMTHKQGQSSTADKTFSAIWPEFTGVFVVSVGADGTAIQTNMLMDRMDAGVTKDEQKQLDAEHDILFYLGTDGASYTFTPESGCTVTVARSTVGKTMTFNGFTSQGVTVDAETGAVTVANLTTGRHIVRVEKDGVATYQVITARGVSYKLLDAEGNELPENAEVKPGETVQLQFTGLVSPKEKMAGVYNQKRDFSTSRTTIHMRFVDNKQKFIVRVRIQPILCICPYFGLDRAKEHIFKHRIVRNENVGAKPLHLKPGNQFCILIIGDMLAIIKFPKKLMEILFDRKFSIFNQLLQKRLFFIRFCIKHFGVSRNK